MKKKVLSGIGIIAILLTLLFYDVISYGFNQAKGQFEIIRNTEPLFEVLNNPEIPDSLKSKIRLIKEIRQFAFDSIGLTPSENYTTFYNQEGETLLWNLSASDPFQLHPKTWSFPFIGSFPYKGYFDLGKAMEEYEQLKSDGFDVRIRAVGGWSTLGWFKDPILSNMLERSEGSLAELIIHELTHSTLFVKNNIEFNENLASFVGEKGAALFLKHRFGDPSQELIEYYDSEEDANTFTNHMLLATKKLDSLYQIFLPNTFDTVKYLSKHVLIDQITSSLDTLPFNNQKYYEIFSQARPNNAYFLSYLRYHSSEDSLSNLLKNEYQNDLSRFIRAMKKHHE